MQKAKELFLTNIRQYAMMVALVFIVLLFQYLTKGVLLRPLNLTNIIQQNSYILVLAIDVWQAQARPRPCSDALVACVGLSRRTGHQDVDGGLRCPEIGDVIHCTPDLRDAEPACHPTDLQAKASIEGGLVHPVRDGVETTGVPENRPVVRTVIDREERDADHRPAWRPDR